MTNISYKIRPATLTDLPTIVELLLDDELGKNREIAGEGLANEYITAFNTISNDSNNHLVVMEHNSTVIGVLQLTILQHLTHKGSKRGHIEGVRINKAYRSQGLGAALIQWAIEKSRQLNCRMVQLTTDLQRPDALEFYKRIGFVASHSGLKFYFNS
jgi:GNAT superfamily N-acetyltransferase